MQDTFAVLSPEYAALLAVMTVSDGRRQALTRRAAKILDLAQQHASEWTEVEERTGVPRLWGIAGFERESSSDYACSPAQGDRWDEISRNVPRGLGPYRCWGDACVAAYGIDHLDAVGKSGWTWTRACYEGELFNGFGPRAHGRRTGYLWSWSNIYDGGKYVADNDWHPGEWDQQCGIVPMMAELLLLDSSLALADALPAQCLPPPFEGSATTVLQAALNRLGAEPPVTIDGSYGRETRRAVAAFQKSHGLTPDGIAGPLTRDLIDKLTNGA